MSWSNWSGRITSSPAEILSVADESAVVEAVRRAGIRNLRVRCVGAGHSHSPLVATDQLLLDPSGLEGVVRVDREAGVAVIRSGSRISSLGAPLSEAGVALRNQGDIDRQSLAGAVATGTHGTGVNLQNLSASVVGARLVLADGRTMDCDAATEPELFQATRLSLGALGVVTELRIAVRDAYTLKERMWLENLDTILERIGDLTNDTRHFEFFWMPGSSRAACKSLAETHEEPVYPLAEEGHRLARSYEVLANDRPLLHTEMEFSVPAERGPDCLRELRDLVARDFPKLAWPLEYRTLAADDVWLSTAFGRPTATISVHQGIDAPDTELFQACEGVLRRYDGRPHWGKVHFLGGEELGRIHERWNDWWNVRDRFDPKGQFLNPYLESMRP